MHEATDVVDQICRAEAEMLSHLKKNLGYLRPSDYNRFQKRPGDLCKRKNEASVVRDGRLFIHPSTQITGMRLMRN